MAKHRTDRWEYKETLKHASNRQGSEQSTHPQVRKILDKSKILILDYNINKDELIGNK